MYSCLSNEELLLRTEAMVREEREIITGVLHCLREVESRMLHAELGFASLYEFCVKHLHYSNGAAHRRISTMRLLKTLPQEMQSKAEGKIEDGSLTLTNLSLLYGFLKVEKKETGRVYTQDEKSDFILGMEHKTKREVEKKFATLQPKILPKESERPVTEQLTEIKFLADETLIQKFKRLREITAHTSAGVGYAQLFRRLADEYLKRHDPLVKAENHQRKESLVTEAKDSGDRINPSRYIPADLRHEVWARDLGRCTYTNSKTHRICGSTFGLEIDHIEPFAFGGKHELTNLRLLCRTHNVHAAKKMFLIKHE